MAVKTIDTFLLVLRKSQLLSPDELSRASLELGATTTPQALAKQLVKLKLLTVWQARQLLAGRYTFVLGRYKLLDRVGQGRYGAVFRAQRSPLGRVVALKVLSVESLADPRIAARFAREVRLTSQLTHPNIVCAFDAENVNGIHFLVMEYVPGRDLKHWINENGWLPIAWACECIRQAAVGLEYVNSLGMVHRDIKPSNLMVTADDTESLPSVKLLDLGMARMIGEEGENEQHRITKDGHVIGTVDYIAPEQVENTREADIRADIFGLGCTLFKAVTGTIPFPAPSLPEKIMARLRGVAPLLSSRRDGIPPGLDELVARMLARNPEDRYQTPAEVVEALTPYAMVETPAPNDSAIGGSVAATIGPSSSPVDARITQLERLVADLQQRLSDVERQVPQPHRRGLPISSRTA